MARSTGPPTARQMRFVEELYRQYRPLMYKYARGRNRGDDEADDIVSETLERLFRHADTVMGLNELQRMNYIVLTVKSAAEDLRRRREARERRFTRADEEDLIGFGPEEMYIERESEDGLIRHLYETLEELSETDRLLLVGRYMRGLSDESLARQLGVKVSSIRMKLTRAKRRARRILEGKEADGDENIG